MMIVIIIVMKIVDPCQFCCDSICIFKKIEFQKYSVALGVAPNAPTFSAAPLHPPPVPNLSGIIVIIFFFIIIGVVVISVVFSYIFKFSFLWIFTAKFTDVRRRATRQQTRVFMIARRLVYLTGIHDHCNLLDCRRVRWILTQRAHSWRRWIFVSNFFFARSNFFALALGIRFE